MSFNPTRAANFRKSQRKRRTGNPHAGIKHSDILRRAGSAIPMHERTQVPHGFTAPVFSGEDFCVRHEVIAPGNNLGLGVNDKADRIVLVKKGTLYATTVVEAPGRDPEAVLKEYQEGFFFVASRGTQYSLATSGTTEAEVYVVESPRYADEWTLLGATVVADVTPSVVTHVNNIPPRRAESKAMEQAHKKAIQSRRKGRSLAATPSGAVAGSSSGTNVNSATVVGVNPRPMGPPRGDD